MKRINWRYAIGELLIVIVGISVAFTINKMAEAQNNRDTAKAYLQSIKSDLSHDISSLDSNVNLLSSRISYMQKLMGHLRVELPGRDTMALAFFNIVDPVSFTPLETTVQSMKFSGDLKLISDLELKKDIVEHYAAYESLSMEIDRHSNFSKDYLAVYFMQNIDYGKMRSGVGFGFFDDPYFHNLVYSLYGIYNLELKAHRESLERARSLHAKL